MSMGYQIDVWNVNIPLIYCIDDNDTLSIYKEMCLDSTQEEESVLWLGWLTQYYGEILNAKYGLFPVNWSIYLYTQS